MPPRYRKIPMKTSNTAPNTAIPSAITPFRLLKNDRRFGGVSSAGGLVPGSLSSRCSTSSSGIIESCAANILETHSFGDLKAESLDRVDLRGMVRQQPDAADTEVLQYLGSYTVIVGLSVSSFPFCGLKINTFLLHQGVCTQLIHKVEIVLT